MNHKSRNTTGIFVAAILFAAALAVALGRGGDIIAPWISSTTITCVFLLLVLISIRVITHFSPRARHRRLVAQRLKNKHCAYCRHDLCAHHPGDKCPECGTRIPPTPPLVHP